MSTHRAGVFRPLAHRTDMNDWWISLRGIWTEYSGLTGAIVTFAKCGAACWPRQQAGRRLRWCPTCYPGRQAIIDEQALNPRDASAPGPGLPTDEGHPGTR